MSLISGLYYSGDPKQKPKQWGPYESVRLSIRNVLARLGEDAGSLLFFSPMWHAGDQRDYAGNFTTTNHNCVFEKNLLSFDGSSWISFSAYEKLKVTAEVTIFAVVTVNKTPINNMNFISVDSNWGYRYRINTNRTLSFFDRGTANNITTSNTLPTDRDVVICAKGESSGLKIFINGDVKASNMKPFAPTYTNPTGAYIGKDSNYDIPLVGDMSLLFVCSSAFSDNNISTLSDNINTLIQPPTFRTYFDFGSTAPYISCNLLAAAAQATKVIQ